MVDCKKVLKLVEEMEREAYYEGRAEGLYTHHESHHTVKTRTEFLNRKALKEKMMGEIKHELDGQPGAE